MLVTPACFPSAELARNSQEHLQRTVKYGGRLQLPSPGETQALLVLERGAAVAGSGGWALWNSLVGDRELGPLATGGLTLQPALAERARNPLAYNSPARGYGLQNQYPDFHGEHGAREEGLGRDRKAVASVLGLPHPGLVAPITHGPVDMAQVVAEVLEELCLQMGITDPQEVQEFALFLIKREGEPLAWGGGARRQAGFQEAAYLPVVCVRATSQAGAGRTAGRAGPGCQGGLWTWAPHAGELVRPLWPHEYLNNVVDQDISLHSRRLGWGTPLHFDNPTYITTHYMQVSCRDPVTPQPQPAGGLTLGCSLQMEPCLGGGRPGPLPLTAVPPGAAGLPTGEAAGQPPGQRPTRQAGRPAAPQQAPRGPAVGVSVHTAPPLLPPLVPAAAEAHLSTYPKGLSFSPRIPHPIFQCQGRSTCTLRGLNLMGLESWRLRTPDLPTPSSS